MFIPHTDNSIFMALPKTDLEKNEVGDRHCNAAHDASHHRNNDKPVFCTIAYYTPIVTGEQIISPGKTHDPTKKEWLISYHLVNSRNY